MQWQFIVSETFFLSQEFGKRRQWDCQDFGQRRQWEFRKLPDRKLPYRKYNLDREEGNLPSSSRYPGKGYKNSDKLHKHYNRYTA